MRTLIILIAVVAASVNAFADGTDSLSCRPKSAAGPEAVTAIGAAEISRLQVESVVEMDGIAPNFHMSRAGARLTAPVFVRGIGGSFGQAAVGLSVDGVPMLNKDSYDFDMVDVDSIEVIRGSQNLLYGRNAMAGQVNIRTISPFGYSGGRLMAQFANGHTMRMSIGWYHRINERAAMSLTGYFTYIGGFFTNSYDNYRVGREKNVSLRWRTSARLGGGWELENVAALQIHKQHGFPVAYEPTGEVCYTDTSYYRRNLLNDGLILKRSGHNVDLRSATSFQYINGRVHFDQDFMPFEYFIRERQRHEWALTQDFSASGRAGAYTWLAGLSGFFKRSTVDAPTDVLQDAVAHLIEGPYNSAHPDAPIRWDDSQFELGNRYISPVYGVAAYHRSTLRLGSVTLTAGLRLEYEHARVSYHSTAETSYAIMSPATGEALSHSAVDIDSRGRLSKGYLELIPKFTALWQMDGSSSLYASVGKGYKPGGFNTLMLPEALWQQMMHPVDGTPDYGAERVTSYRPEHSWNYEVGAHLDFPSANLSADAAIYYIDCRHRQMAYFPEPSGAASVVTNSGRTRSIGGELTLRWQPVESLRFMAAYGLTDARYVRCNDGRADYSGNRVPFVPANTLFGSATWGTELPSIGSRIELNANVRCAGYIWWDDANTWGQRFYAVPSVSATLTRGGVSLQLWCRNVTGSRYDVVGFDTVGYRMIQRGTPRNFGATLRLNFATGRALF